MMNTNTAARRDNKGAYIFVSSPVSGRQYRFYYGKAVRDAVKAIVLLVATLLVVASIAKLVLRTGDAEYEYRMQMQQEHINSINSGQSDFVSFEGGE